MKTDKRRDAVDMNIDEIDWFDLLLCRLLHTNDLWLWIECQCGRYSLLFFFFGKPCFAFRKFNQRGKRKKKRKDDFGSFKGAMPNTCSANFYSIRHKWNDKIIIINNCIFDVAGSFGGCDAISSGNVRQACNHVHFNIIQFRSVSFVRLHWNRSQNQFSKWLHNDRSRTSELPAASILIFIYEWLNAKLSEASAFHHRMPPLTFWSLSEIEKSRKQMAKTYIYIYILWWWSTSMQRLSDVWSNAFAEYCFATIPKRKIITFNSILIELKYANECRSQVDTNWARASRFQIHTRRHTTDKQTIYEIDLYSFDLSWDVSTEHATASFNTLCIATYK